MVMTPVLQGYRKQCCKKGFFELQPRSFYLLKILICNTATLFSGFCAQAADLGTYGSVYPIEEQDPLQLIQQKLKIIEENGELTQHYRELKKKTRAAVERPTPVVGLTKATEPHVFYYDPTLTVKEDMKDHLGNIINAKGTKINPLETVSLSQDLLFFDGDDEEQVGFVKQRLSEKSMKLILVKGTPLSLSEELRLPVYFDQGGVLTKKLGIQHVPAVVTQAGLRLRIEEISLTGEQK